MLNISPILKRTSLAKTLGLVIGILTFVSIPRLFGVNDPMLQWGMLGWYITFGAVIGLGGFVNNIPFLNWRFAPWIRGGLYGAWLNLVLVLLAYDNLVSMTAGFWGLPNALTSPWWLIVDGIFLGALIDMIISWAVKDINWPKSEATLAA